MPDLSIFKCNKLLLIALILHIAGCATSPEQKPLDVLDATRQLLISRGIQAGHNPGYILLRNNIGGLCNQGITVM